MKKSSVLIYLSFVFASLSSQGQAIRYVYYLDTDLNVVQKSKASILGKGIKESDLFRLDCYSIAGDMLFLTVYCKDSTLAVFHGPFSSYHKNRKLEKTGNYESNLKEGLWQAWDSLGRKTDSIIYLHDLKMVKAEFGYRNNGKLRYRSLEDSLQNSLHSIEYDSSMKIEREFIFKGQQGVMKTYTATGIESENLYTRKETEANFPGGEMGWRKYLANNLDANTPIDRKAPNGVYQVIVRFIVGIDGTITDVVAETYFGYGMEQEVIRVIQKGPKWIPAEQYGRKVKAYRRQPATFVVDGG